MSRNRNHSGKESVLPSDVEWVVIEASDGSPTRWPTNTEPNPDGEGHINYMKLLGNDNSFAIKWRLQIGKALAEMLKYPGFGMPHFSFPSEDTSNKLPELPSRIPGLPQWQANG